MTAAPRRAELALALASLLLAAGVAEVAVRLAVPAGPAATGYAPVNTARRERAMANSRGYRDAERAVPAPAGVRRVLSLGDSFAWGHGIEAEDAYPARIERRLRRERAGEAWEVVNLALPGLRSVDHAQQLRDEGFAYGPELVLLGYVLNDSEDADAAEARRALDWQAQAGPSPSFFDRSALVRFVRFRLFATAENRRRVEGYRSMYAEDAPGWRAGRQALLAMGEQCRARGVPFVVAIWPLLGNPLDERYPFAAIHESVAQAAAAGGATVVDLLPVFRGLRSEVLVVDGADDEHPNEVAHRIAAGAIHRSLAAIGFQRRGEPVAGPMGAPSPTELLRPQTPAGFQRRGEPVAGPMGAPSPTELLRPQAPRAPRP
ncbi:MAG: SGNH/GDSL hydrolase family protein [Vicinamibacteria bacterium]|nr:SGNH/GDSL hydrolase family protein [Vicinamibacteria bacterium]